MTVFLKQATVATVLIGPFVDNSDGYTPETALTITAAEVLISKNGTGLAGKNEASAATHDAAGYYTVSLDTDDTDSAGALRIVVNESGAFPVWQECAVLTSAAWDALFDGKAIPADVSMWNGSALGASDTAGYPKVTIKDGTGTGELDTLSGKVLLQDGAVTAAVVATGAIDADAIADNAIDAGAIATGAITAAKFAAGAIDAAALAADAVDEILDEVVEGSLTMRQVLRLALSALAGKAAGGGTTTITFRDNADSKNRISATVDASGNRTAVTLDGS